MDTVSSDRTRARRIALQVLYQLDVTGEKPGESHKTWVADLTTRQAAREYAWFLIDGCLNAREDLDRQIEAHAKRWSIDRMAPVDRNVMRIGAYELLYVPVVPPAVAIDEAVRLAKRYGQNESGGFVNAVLDAIYKDREKEAENGV